MKTSWLILLLCLSGTFVYGQKILTIDFDNIRQKTGDTTASYYYPDLIRRFSKGDTLSREELRCVYYGAVFNREKEAKPSDSDPQSAFNELYAKQDYRAAIAPGLAILKADPVNVRMNYKMLVCYHHLNIKDSAHLFARRYYGLIAAIQSSGDGISTQTAFVVTRVPDEYDVVKEAGFRSTGQSLLEPESGHTDKLHLDMEAQTKEPKIPALYFNVEITFIMMAKLFEDVQLTIPEMSKSKK